MELDELRHEHFAERIGERFEVTAGGDGGTVVLHLSLATRPGDDRPDNAHFVEWTGPRDVFLEQGIYVLRHDELGELALFLVPVNEVEEGFVYEAVFTRVED
ncbi:MAG: DUF6916 family protein [Ilumatobacteraceae bacterium]